MISFAKGYGKNCPRLYLWAPGGGVPTNVEAKKRSVSFDLSGRSYIQVVGINTLASTITTDSNTSHCLLSKMTCNYVSHSDNNTTNSQGASNNEQAGLGIILDGSYNEINSCELAYSSSNIVFVKGSNNNIINCYIHDGEYVPNFDGIVLLGGKNSLISNNTICRSGRGLINADMNWGGTKSWFSKNIIYRLQLIQHRI